MSDFVQQNASNVDFSSMGSNSWVILSPIELSIKKKIEAVGVPLKDWDINIYRGVLTGYNEAFIISTEKRNEILSNCQSEDERQRTEELIRPILRGRDIKRYGYEWADLWLIATFPSRHYDIELYPAVKDYLLSFGMERLEQTGKEYIVHGEKIKARKKTNNKWFETQDSISYWDDFFKPKIAWGNLNLSGTYSFVPAGVFINAPSTFISTSKQSILHILNSKLADFYIRSLGVTRNGGYFEYKPMFVDKLPIPPNHINFKELEEISNYPSDIEERRIENLIYSIYGLSEAEIRYLEKDKS
ncbi:MAG: type II restriction endonuclease [Clostridiales bacterium]|nr:type II restriction endonuclease [Clostridiales bacterium]